MQRRHVLTAALLATCPRFLLGRSYARERKETIAPTPGCDERPTPPQTAGPFYIPDSPRRNSLREGGMPGQPLVVTGVVRDTTCRPLAGALLEVWHADSSGRYDTRGYRLRGHFFADDAGRYRLETIAPGPYPGRTPHIHVRVEAPGRPILVTQLYFPGQPRNHSDFLFRPELLMELKRGKDLLLARFDFALKT